MSDTSNSTRISCEDCADRGPLIYALACAGGCCVKQVCSTGCRVKCSGCPMWSRVQTQIMSGSAEKFVCSNCLTLNTLSFVPLWRGEANGDDRITALLDA